MRRLEPIDCDEVLRPTKLGIAGDDNRVHPVHRGYGKGVGVRNREPGLQPGGLKNIIERVPHGLQRQHVQVAREDLRLLQGPILRRHVVDLSHVDLIHEKGTLDRSASRRRDLTLSNPLSLLRKASMAKESSKLLFFSGMV